MISSLVVAASSNETIGDGGTLPWHLPDDLRHFRNLTAGHPVILGRVTHESILSRLSHPLSKRTSIVLSSRRHNEAENGVLWADSMESAVVMAQEMGARHAASEFFVIGGASVYRQALPFVDKVYLTRIHLDVAGDASMPAGWLDSFRMVASEDWEQAEAGCSFSFLEYRRERP